MRRWEYAVHVRLSPRDNQEHEELEKQLDKWGANGWNLVAVVSVGIGLQYTFKRELEAQS